MDIAADPEPASTTLVIRSDGLVTEDKTGTEGRTLHRTIEVV